MKYRLSTLLLVILTVALAFGWYVDHHDRSRRELLGSWHYPTPDQPMTGYYSSLVIRADGTFTKSQSDRFTTTTFDGKYSIHIDGQIVFHVTSKLDENPFDPLRIPPKVPASEQLNSQYTCRCAVDKDGYLIVARVARLRDTIEQDDCGIRWEQSFRRGR